MLVRDLSTSLFLEEELEDALDILEEDGVDELKSRKENLEKDGGSAALGSNLTWETRLLVGGSGLCSSGGVSGLLVAAGGSD